MASDHKLVALSRQASRKWGGGSETALQRRYVLTLDTRIGFAVWCLFTGSYGLGRNRGAGRS